MDSEPPSPVNRLTPFLIGGAIVVILAIVVGAVIATGGGSGHRGGGQIPHGSPSAARSDLSEFDSLWAGYLPVAGQSSQSLASAQTAVAQQQQQADADASLAAQDSTGAGCPYSPTDPNSYQACRTQGQQNAASEEAAESAAQAAANADAEQVTTAAQSWIAAITTMLKGWGRIQWVPAAVPDESTFYGSASNLRSQLQDMLDSPTPTSGAGSTSNETQLTADEAALASAQAALQGVLQTAGH